MGNDLARRQSESLAVAATPETARSIIGGLEVLTGLRTFIREAFVKGTDAGTIPGCGDKEVLLLPGAQKVAMYMGVYPTYSVTTVDLGNGHVEYQVKTALIDKTTGHQVGEGIGCASTREKKFRRGSGRPAGPPCPSCKRPLFKSKHKDEFFCWREKGGCGLNVPANDPRIKAIPAAPVEDEGDPYEVRNTVLKMGKKRSLVDASMTLACVSELFTQDLDDTFTAEEIRVANLRADVIDAEVVEPPKPKIDNKSGHGTGKYASPDEVRQWKAIKSELLDKLQQDYMHKQWQPRLDAMLEKGQGVPTDDAFLVYNNFAFNGHLIKWAIAENLFDPTMTIGDVKGDKADDFLAILYHRRDTRPKLSAEFRRYFAAKAEAKTAELYRKHPELATPDEPAEEPRDRGDAYEPEDATARAGAY